MFNRTWLIDTFERTLRTFIQGFLAVMLASLTDGLDASALEGAFVGGLAAAGAVVMSAIAALNNREGAGFTVEAKEVAP